MLISFVFFSSWVIHCCWLHSWQQLVWNICFLNTREYISHHLIDKIWPLVLSWDHPWLCDGPVMLFCCRGRSAWVWVALQTPKICDAGECARSCSKSSHKWWHETSTQANTPITCLFISSGQRWSIRQTTNIQSAYFYMTVNKPSFKALIEIYMFMWNIQ